MLNHLNLTSWAGLPIALSLLAACTVETSSIQNNSADKPAASIVTQVNNFVEIQEPEDAISNLLDPVQEVASQMNNETNNQDITTSLLEPNYKNNPESNENSSSNEPESVLTRVYLPEKAGQMSVVNYALSSTNDVGVKLYFRRGYHVIQRGEERKSCKDFVDPEAAQQHFLDTGGPQNDNSLLDPDGDGYACKWDPGPYRRLLK